MTWTEDDERAELARVADAMMHPSATFVFGSNLAGIHGGGAAAFAHRHYGAVWGRGEGLQGRSYAWPTKDWQIDTLPVYQVATHAQRFVDCAASQPHLQFIVTRVGCGLAGLTDDVMVRTLPAWIPANVQLPPRWVALRERGW